MKKASAVKKKVTSVSRSHPTRRSERISNKGEVPSTSPKESHSNDDFCFICNNVGGILICCDMCENACHEECLGLATDSLPDQWYCQSCCAMSSESNEEGESSEGEVPSAATSDDHHVNVPHLAAEQYDKGRLLGGVPSAPPLAAKHHLKNGIKIAAKAILRNTLREKDAIQARFNKTFEASPPNPNLGNIMRQTHEEVSIKSDCINYAAMIYPKMKQIVGKGFDRPISAENTQHSRMSHAFNISIDLFSRAPDAVMIYLEGTSSNLPDATAAQNMSALQACIQAGVCDLDEKYLAKIVMVVMKIELLPEESDRSEHADTHGILVIHRLNDACQFGVDFQLFLQAHGAMGKAMHVRDSMRVGIGFGVDSPQKTFNWVAYILKAKVDNYKEETRERIRIKMIEANIPSVGNAHNMLSMYHKKK